MKSSLSAICVLILTQLIVSSAGSRNLTTLPRQCIEGFYLDNVTSAVDGIFCKPCHSSCRTCTGPTPRQCTGCLYGDARLQHGVFDDAFLCVDQSAVDGIWTSEPDADYLYGVHVLTDVDRSKNCYRGCQTCLGPHKSECNRCSPGFIAFPPKDLKYSSIGESTFRCVAICRDAVDNCTFPEQISRNPHPLSRTVHMLGCADAYYRDNHGICRLCIHNRSNCPHFGGVDNDSTSKVAAENPTKDRSSLSPKTRMESGVNHQTTSINCICNSPLDGKILAAFCCFLVLVLVVLSCCKIWEKKDDPIEERVPNVVVVERYLPGREAMLEQNRFDVADNQWHPDDL